MKGIFGIFSSFFVLALLLAPAGAFAASSSATYDMGVFLNQHHPFDTGTIQQQNAIDGAPPAMAASSIILPEPMYAQEIDLPGRFTADEINVDHELGVIAARGNVKAVYEQWTLTADLIRFNQQTNAITAWGNVRLQEPGLDVVFADFMMLSDDFKNGILEAIHIAANGGRPDTEAIHIAANGGRPDTEAIVPDTEERIARDTFIAPLKNKNPFYVSVGSGIVRVAEFNSSFFFRQSDSNRNTQTRDFHDGWAGSLRMGYRLNDHLRGEIEYAYSKSALRNLHDFARPFPDFIIPDAPGTLKQNTIMINGYWDIREYVVGAYVLTPYIGGGLGVTRVNYKHGVFTVPGTTVTFTEAEADEWAWTTQLRAGLRFQITPAISISPEYSYRLVNGVTLKVPAAEEFSRYGKVDAYGTHQLMVLLEYHFGQ